MRKINYIVWHTAADGRKSKVPGQPSDTTAKDIDLWHRQDGWAGNGYNYVIRLDGSIETARPIERVPAHVKGLNSVSIGICFSGHGDLFELTPDQVRAGLKLTRELMDRFDIPGRQVIGHREVNDLVDRGIVARKYRTNKSCPGNLVSMEKIRERLAEPTVPVCKNCLTCTCKSVSVLH
jgi:hypothetical protein